MRISLETLELLLAFGDCSADTAQRAWDRGCEVVTFGGDLFYWTGNTYKSCGLV